VSSPDPATTSPDTDAALASLPKVELHVHLEGSISAGTAAELATRHGEDPGEVLEVERTGRRMALPTRFRDFDHFVDTFLATTGQVRSPDDLTEVAAAFARSQQRQGVVWTETTFTALTLVDAGMDPQQCGPRCATASPRPTSRWV
jgi:adenosine deaminase